MDIQYVDTDITSVGFGVIGHGVNCQGVMGAGVALAIRKKWPVVYDRYKDNDLGREMLGSAHIIRVGFDLWVANCYTQEFYGREPGRKYASVDAIYQSVEFVYSFMQDEPNCEEYHFPMIGCNLGGLNWESDVRPIFEELNRKYDTKPTFIHDYKGK